VPEVCPQVAFLGVSWHWGGFAKYVNVYDYMCYRLPEEVSFDVGALVEPFAATVRAVKRAGVESDETVSVIGAGPIGLMAIQSAKIAGAKQVIAFEPAEKRKELALQCGASEVINPLLQDPIAEIQKRTDGEGSDVVIECSGREQTGVLAGRVARRVGRIIVMGVFEHPSPFDYTDLVYGEKTIIGSMGGYGVFDEAIGMMAKQQFNGNILITGKVPLDEIVGSGFSALINHKEENVKILVSPD
jgi:(R,R)-butanediol dehydrogenase/meso-butanediol dehydrogenase/diacetyl reductase